MDEKQEVLKSVAEMTAGEMLRNARTTGRRKREIATIAKLLCIREEFLTALEEGNYRVIPEDVYILGFARSYAVELGLNPDEIILKLKHELGIIQEPAEEEEIIAPKKTIKTIKKEDLKKFAKIGVQYVKKHWIWFASGFVVVLLTVILLVIFTGKKTDVITEIKTDTDKVTTVSSEPDFRYPVRERFEQKNRQDAKVVLQAEKESWIKIEDSKGNTVFSRVLLPGDIYYLPNTDNLKATFGNINAVDVWVDGQLLNKLGPANTRKSGVSMSPNALKTVGFAE
ncbi:MAG: helix-turn-helix domain-containing protein [Alphaproteobacteria bacterium]|nr:helix-turn-helix domain-containing protein [Alphaproteobacteria bacterium]